MLIDWQKMRTNLAKGDWVQHRGAGVVGRVKKVWEPSTFGDPVCAVECVELEDGNVLLGFEADGTPTFEHLQEKEAVLFRQIQGVVAYDIALMVRVAAQAGVSRERALGLAQTVVAAQLRELSK